MSERDFEAEFWDIVVAYAERDHIVRRWAAKIMAENVDTDFLELPPLAQIYIYENYGLNAERATEVVELSKEKAEKRARGEA